MFESVKALFKLREYRRLVNTENIHTFIDFDVYKNLKDAEEYEAGFCKMQRQEREVAKPKSPIINKKL